MNELFLEIEEDIRREKYEKFWRSFGRVMVLASLALLLVTAAFVMWQSHRQSDAAEKTAQLLKGIDRLNIEDYKGAVPLFSALTDDDGSRYYGVAMLRKAQAQALSGDKEGAQKTYGALAGKNSEFADMAKLKTIGGNEVAEVGAASPFYYTLTETRAWALLDQGKKAEAAELFYTLASDEKTPRSLVGRARDVLQHIAPEKVKKDE